MLKTKIRQAIPGWLISPREAPIVRDLRAENEDLVNTIITYEEKYDALGDAYRSLESELEELQTRYDKVMASLKEEKAKRTITIKHNYKNLVLERDLWQRRSIRQREELHRLENKVQDLKQENEDVYRLCGELSTQLHDNIAGISDRLMEVLNTNDED